MGLVNKKKKTEKLNADSFRPEAPKKTVKNTSESGGGAVVSSGDFTRGEGFSLSSVTQHKPLLFAVSFATLLIIGAVLFFVIDNKNESRSASNTSTEQQSVLDLDAEIMTAMEPVNRYDFKKAQANLLALAEKTEATRDNRNYLVNLFYVCLELQDEECKEDTAGRINDVATTDQLKKDRVSPNLIKDINGYKK